MSENEAIKELSYDNTAYGGKCTEEVRRVAIKALEIVDSFRSLYPLQDFEEEALMELVREIQQYRAIGLTPQMVKDLIASEKQAHKIALENAEMLDDYRKIGTIEDFLEAKTSAEWTYEDLKAYKAIGTVEECRTAVERMKPKKVAYQGEHEKCPACGSFHVFGNHCTECGQAIDWSD